MTPISEEKRALPIAAKERGEKEADIVKWLEISKRSVGALWKLYRDTGNCAAKKYPGRTCCLSNEELNRICAEIEANPDITLAEIIEKLELKIHKSRLSVILISYGYSFKKRRSTQQINSERMLSNNEKSGKRIRKR
jgi:transposase